MALEYQLNYLGSTDEWVPCTDEGASCIWLWVEKCSSASTDLGGRQFSVHGKGGVFWMSGEQSECVMGIACLSGTLLRDPSTGREGSTFGYTGEET